MDPEAHAYQLQEQHPMITRMQEILDAGKITRVESTITFGYKNPLIEVDMGLDPFDGPWERLSLYQVTTNLYDDTTEIVAFRVDENDHAILVGTGNVVRMKVRRNGYRLAE
jgi:hypothetical protein